MQHALPALDRFKVFESAARHLSFSLAAKELCISKGAVSYQIRQLEQSLDCLLFQRSVRQVYLTQAGQKLFQLVKVIFADLQKGLAQIAPSSPYDIVIGASTYVAARWLSPRVAKFLKRQPDTSVLFEHNIHRTDFSLEDVDFGLIWGRCAPPTQPAGADIVRQIPMPLYPVCSPALGQKIEQEPRYLKQATLLSEGRQQDLWLEWFEGSPVNPRQIIEDANVRVQAAIDGQGLVMADAMMQAELASGALVAPFKQVLSGYGYLLTTARARSKNQQAQAMLQWLAN